MSEPFIGEIRAFAFNFAPRGWAPCEGQLLPISQNQALFALLGTTYGGDGRSTFALPDLRGRTIVAVGAAAGGETRVLGEPGGEERHQLTIAELPGHGHQAHASASAGTSDKPTNNVWAAARH